MACLRSWTSNYKRTSRLNGRKYLMSERSAAGWIKAQMQWSASALASPCMNPREETAWKNHRPTDDPYRDLFSKLFSVLADRCCLLAFDSWLLAISHRQLASGMRQRARGKRQEARSNRQCAIGNRQFGCWMFAIFTRRNDYTQEQDIVLRTSGGQVPT